MNAWGNNNQACCEMALAKLECMDRECAAATHWTAVERPAITNFCTKPVLEPVDKVMVAGQYFPERGLKQFHRFRGRTTFGFRTGPMRVMMRHRQLMSDVLKIPASEHDRVLREQGEEKIAKRLLGHTSSPIPSTLINHMNRATFLRADARWGLPSYAATTNFMMDPYDAKTLSREFSELLKYTLTEVEPWKSPELAASLRVTDVDVQVQP